MLCRFVKPITSLLNCFIDNINKPIRSDRIVKKSDVGDEFKIGTHLEIEVLKRVYTIIKPHGIKRR